MHLKIGKAMHNAATRIASLPPLHPLHKAFRRASNRQPQRHKTLLQQLAMCLGAAPERIEEIPVVRINPALSQRIPVSISIPENKEASTQAEELADETVRVYTDGSAHNGKVGAAAILCRPGKPDRVLRAHLGIDKHHTVYEAELAGILLGLHLIKTERNVRSNAS